MARQRDVGDTLLKAVDRRWYKLTKKQKSMWKNRQEFRQYMSDATKTIVVIDAMFECARYRKERQENAYRQQEE